MSVAGSLKKEVDAALSDSESDSEEELSLLSSLSALGTASRITPSKYFGT